MFKLFLIFLFVAQLGFSQERPCVEAVFWTDSAYSFSSIEGGQKWLRINSDKQVKLGKIPAGTVVEVFEEGPDFCHLLLKDSVKPSIVAGNAQLLPDYAKIKLDLEEKGKCSCDDCFKNARVILPPAKSYLIKIMNESLEGTITFSFGEEPKEKKNTVFSHVSTTPGTKIALNRIHFQPESAQFLPVAKEELQALLDFMKTNSKVKVEIQGHVNYPGKKCSEKDQKLSEDRAKAVAAYLSKNGISKTRLVAKGYGNTMMVYPKPKTEEEMQKNRRVEVVILSN